MVKQTYKVCRQSSIWITLNMTLLSSHALCLQISLHCNNDQLGNNTSFVPTILRFPTICKQISY